MPRNDNNSGNMLPYYSHLPVQCTVYSIHNTPLESHLHVHCTHQKLPFYQKIKLDHEEERLCYIESQPKDAIVKLVNLLILLILLVLNPEISHTFTL